MAFRINFAHNVNDYKPVNSDKWYTTAGIFSSYRFI